MADTADPQPRDPGDRSELHESYRRSLDLYASELTPSTPGSGSGSGSGSDAVPLDSDVRIGEVTPPLDAPRLPHSTSSFDLRSSALTPKADRVGRLGLSRIPQSTVMHAVALQPLSPSSPGTRSVSSPTPHSERSPLLGPHGYSPETRKLGSAASTRVIDGLQTDLQHMRTQMDKNRQDLRSSQRIVESLTRQNEDLKETRERLRNECDQLNTVIARKERLLQETAEKKRAAEGELKESKAARHALEKTTRKSVQTMTAQVTEAHAAQHQAESECTSLRDAVRSLREVWARDVKGVKDEWRRGVERDRAEREQLVSQHASLVKTMASQTAERKRVEALAEDVLKRSADASTIYKQELAALRQQVEDNSNETRNAQAIAKGLADELMHLRRLMREPPRDD